MSRASWGSRCAVLGVCAVALLGCPKPVETCVEGNEEACDAGAPPPDVCKTRDEALTSADCQLAVAVCTGGAVGCATAKQGYIAYAGNQHYYLAQLPASLTARSLLHVYGGYSVPNTAVNFTINVMREDGTTSLSRKTDAHGQAAPKPLDITLPFSEASARLLLLVSDEQLPGKNNFDAKNPFTIAAEVLENPDSTEPNDTTPSPIALAAQGAEQVGQATGYLATENDVDKFSFVAPAGRKIVYLHITAPKLTPAPPYIMSYTLVDPTGKPIAEGRMQNEFLAVDLATARITTAGAYTLVVQGFRAPGVTAPIPGDLRLKYTVDVRIMDDQDTHEPDDTFATAKGSTLALGSPVSFTGRISYVPDLDYYAFALAPNSSPTVLRYRLRPLGSGGRFTQLPGLVDREVRVMTLVQKGATAPDRQANCRLDRSECPKGYEGSANFQALVEGLCVSQDPPPCLHSQRMESLDHGNLGNFEGAIPVPPHGANVLYYVVVQDDGNNWADDRDYQLTVEWQTDPDEATRAGLPSQTQATTLSDSASFPDPPTAGEVSGTLTFGYGRMVNYDINQGQGVRGPEDYDAVPSDLDRFEWDFASPTAVDKTWTLQWEIQKVDGGVPADLSLALEFCGGADGGCAGSGAVLAYSGQSLQPWYGSGLGARAVLWDRQDQGASVVVTAKPVSCLCFESRFVQAGRFFGSVGLVDRNFWAPIQYKVRAGSTDYPKSFGVDGGTSSCPAPVDGGGGCQISQSF